jgi:type IV pilus assembly protein PilY1
MLLLLSLCVVTKSYGQSEIPVLVQTPNAAKVMMVVDDSGSMNAVVEHDAFDVASSCATDSTKKLPSVIFRLQSGASAPTTSQQLTPVLIELNYGFNTDGTGNLYGAQAFNVPTSFPLIARMTCNTTSGSTTCCPGTSGGSCPKTGINTGALFSNSAITGASVFATANLAKNGASNVVDSSGNEYLYLSYRRNDYYTLTDDWGSVWAKFDTSGNALEVNTTPFATTGGTVVFNNKEVFLSAGWYRAEYLRWIFYCATDAERSALPGVSRIQAVKDVMTSLISLNPNVSFGITSLNGSTYSAGVHNAADLVTQWYTPMGEASTCGTARVKAPVGTAASSLYTTINSLTAKGGTPLQMAYVESLRYMAGVSKSDSCTSSGTYTSPITGLCDAHSIILLTDGLPTSESAKKLPNGNWITNLDSQPNPASSNNNCSGDSTCIASFLPDAAWWGYHTDLRATIAGIQNVMTYTIGFGIDVYPLLDKTAADGGTASAYSANSVATLTDVLQNIMNIIFDTPTSGAGVATLEKLYGETKVYQPIFYADEWNGHIQVFNYNAATEALDFDFDIATVLEERNLSTNARNIIAGYDVDGDGRTNSTLAFSATNAASLRPLLFKFYDNASLSSTLLPVPIQSYSTTAAAQKLIDYINGTNFAGMRLRDRDQDGLPDRLGDIVYSKPVEVGPKNGNYNMLTGYTDYVAGKQSEPRLLLAGANDGMLHAFNSETGEELWAYIPSSQIPYLERLSRLNYNTQARRSYVDGPIMVEDVYTNGAWRTYAIFGLRTGGSTYTVLDISDRDNPTLVWEVSDPTIYGQSWIKPAVVLSGGAVGTVSPGTFTWNMVVGTGEGKTSAGVNLAVYNLGSSTPPAATTVAISAAAPAGTRSTAIATSQNDQDRAVDRLYLGTEEGDLYRVRVTAAASGWTVAKVFDGVTTQPIVAAPITVLAENPQYTGAASGIASLPLAVGVYWGTGRHDAAVDISTVGLVSQGIFGIFDPVNISDDTFAAPLGTQAKANLQNQSIGSFNVRRGTNGKYYVPTGKAGFYMDMATTITVTSNDFINPVGEIVNPPINVFGMVLFTTFLPDSGTCDIGGHGFVQGVHFQTGGGAVVDYHLDSEQPFYNGGIADLNGNGQYNSSDLQSGFTGNAYQAVLDVAVENIDLTSAVPYEHDGVLDIADVRLHASNGGIEPAVSNIGHTGLPSSPTVLFGAKKLLLQDAYPTDPTTTPGSSGGSGGEDGGDVGGTDQMPPPKLAPMNIYNLPIDVLSFHEYTGN